MASNFVNVLAFDGGGSRGLMEVLLLQHVMLLVSVIKQQPAKITSLINNDPMLETETSRQTIQDLMAKVDKAVHPTEVFNYIVGKFLKFLVGLDIFASLA